MPRLAFLIALTALALLPASAAAKPAVCYPTVIQDALIAAGKLTQDDLRFGPGVDLVRCHDVTNDDRIDAVFTVGSGGTAGDTHFGVLLGRDDGSSGKLQLYRAGYNVGVSVRSRHSFETIQPHYRSTTPTAAELVPHPPLHVDRRSLQAGQGRGRSSTRRSASTRPESDA